MLREAHHADAIQLLLAGALTKLRIDDILLDELPRAAAARPV
ncbi:MAG: hypothetical protein JWQ20_1947, partial [Conexibacter sp.]|nr:hypothetical protein [Conexibacter sp.]